jgi:hypothetical protein
MTLVARDGRFLIPMEDASPLFNQVYTVGWDTAPTALTMYRGDDGGLYSFGELETLAIVPSTTREGLPSSSLYMVNRLRGHVVIAEGVAQTSSDMDPWCSGTSECAPRWGLSTLHSVAAGACKSPDVCALADVTGDGLVDLINVDRTTGNGTLAVHRNQGTPLDFHFAPGTGDMPLASTTVASNQNVGFGDVDGDGVVDLVRFLNTRAVTPATVGTPTIGTLVTP